MVAAPATRRAGLLFRAFSDPTRIRILRLLRDGELCVGDVRTVLRIPQPRTSRHLAYLRRAGLVSTRKSGLWVFHALSPARDPFHAKLLECLDDCFGDLPEIRSDARRAGRLREAGGCCPQRFRGRRLRPVNP